jgi:predicted ribosomally synthesized peptide with SipW-like signal peptide
MRWAGWIFPVFWCWASMADVSSAAEGPRYFLGVQMGKFYPRVPEMRWRIHSDTDLKIQGLRFQDRSFQFPLFYHIVVWVSFPGTDKWVGVAFTHAKIYCITQKVVKVRGVHRGVQVNQTVPLSEYIQRLSVSHGLNLVLMQVAAQVLEKRWFRVLVAAGSGPVLAHSESRIADRSYYGYELAGPALTVQLECDLDMRRGWRGLLAVAGTWASLSDVKVAQGKVTMSVYGLQLRFGVGKVF